MERFVQVMQNFIKKHLFLLFISMVIILGHSFIYANTIIVAKDGSGDFTNINAAVSSAFSGDTIFVMNGHYGGFGVFTKDLVFIEESNDSTIVEDSRIHSNIRCEIRNFRFKGRLMSKQYVYYDQVREIPELVIRDCHFEFYNLPPDDWEFYLRIEITFDKIVKDNPTLLDTLASKIKIFNNSFIDTTGDKVAIEFTKEIIVGKLLSKSSGMSLLEINGNHNYFTATDSLSVDSLIYDYYDPALYGGIGTNRTVFDFSHWSDTLITKKINMCEGIQYNNFINFKKWAFVSYLFYDSTVNINDAISAPKNYQLVRVYHNPFNSRLILQIELPVKQEVSVNVYDVLGRALPGLNKTFTLGAGTNKLPLNFGNYSSGPYYIQVKTANQIFTKKVILKK